MRVYAVSTAYCNHNRLRLQTFLHEELLEFIRREVGLPVHIQHLRQSTVNHSLHRGFPPLPEMLAAAAPQLLAGICRVSDVAENFQIMNSFTFSLAGLLSSLARTCLV